MNTTQLRIRHDACQRNLRVARRRSLGSEILQRLDQVIMKHVENVSEYGADLRASLGSFIVDDVTLLYQTAQS